MNPSVSFLQSRKHDIIKLVKRPNFVLQLLCECGLVQYESTTSLATALESIPESKLEIFAKILCLTGHYAAFDLLSGAQLRQHHLSQNLPPMIENVFDPSRLDLSFHCPSLPAKLGIRKFSHLGNTISDGNLKAVLDRLANLFVLKLELTQIQAICKYLVLYEVLDSAQMLRICGASKETACRKLLCLLAESNCVIAMERFAHALVLSCQWVCFVMLKGERVLRINVLEEIGHIHWDFLMEFENRENQPLPPTSNMAICFDEPIDVDSDPEDEKIYNEPAGELEISVNEVDSNAFSEFEKNKDHVYANFSEPKGHVLIINNEHFKDGYLRRKGTEVDEKNIRSLLEKMGYRVGPTKKDLSAVDMLRAARTFSAHPDHQFADSAVVVVMTHGKYDRLVGSDERDIDVHEFLACFNAKNAPLLRGKPKLFFLQACRGEVHDNGIPKHGTDSTDMKSLTSLFSCMRPTPTRATRSFNANNEYMVNPSPPEAAPAPSVLPPFPEAVSIRFGNNLRGRASRALSTSRPPKSPTEADMLVAFATTPRYVSWRNQLHGSWFIQSICEVFSKFAANEDICKLLTRVNRRVAEVYESDQQREKQISEFVNRLQKQFFFFPGAVRRKVVVENCGTAV